MKLLDILLIVCAIALLVASYFLNENGYSALWWCGASFGATLCGAVFGARWGGRLHKKNQENK